MTLFRAAMVGCQNGERGIGQCQVGQCVEHKADRFVSLCNCRHLFRRTPAEFVTHGVHTGKMHEHDLRTVLVQDGFRTLGDIPIGDRFVRWQIKVVHRVRLQEHYEFHFSGNHGRGVACLLRDLEERGYIRIRLLNVFVPGDTVLFRRSASEHAHVTREGIGFRRGFGPERKASRFAETADSRHLTTQQQIRPQAVDTDDQDSVNRRYRALNELRRARNLGS